MENKSGQPKAYASEAEAFAAEDDLLDQIKRLDFLRRQIAYFKVAEHMRRCGIARVECNADQNPGELFVTVQMDRGRPHYARMPSSNGIMPLWKKLEGNLWQDAKAAKEIVEGLIEALRGLGEPDMRKAMGLETWAQSWPRRQWLDAEGIKSVYFDPEELAIWAHAEIGKVAKKAASIRSPSLRSAVQGRGKARRDGFMGKERIAFGGAW